MEWHVYASVGPNSQLVSTISYHHNCYSSELPQIARRRRSASGYKRQIATSGPPPVSRCSPTSAHRRLATVGPPSAGHCCADNVSHIEKYKK